MAQTTAKEWFDKGMATNDHHEEIEYFSKAIQLNPQYAAAYYNRGLSKRKLNRHQEAITDCDEAIRLDPKYLNAYIVRGNSKQDLGRHQEAIADYDEAIRLDPTYARAYYNRGWAKDELGQYQQAIYDFDVAIRLDPKYGNAYINRAISKRKLGRHQEAIVDLDEAIRLDPKDAISYFIKGRSLVNLNRCTEALELFRQGEALDPNQTFYLDDKKKAQTCATPAPASGKRLALVIGNSTYQYGSSLQGRPLNDAQDMAARLRSLGFQVLLHTDANQQAMRQALLSFSQQIDRRTEVAMVFYAGHGIEVGGQNYLIPTDARLTRPSDANLEAINVQMLLNELKTSGATFCVAVLDACRNDPFRYWPATVRADDDRGFKVISDLAGEGNMYLAMATGWKNVAQNGTGRNGVYTESLLNYLRAGQTIESVFQDAAVEVKERTQQRQNPQLITEYATRRRLTL
ncbi:caspase family protein [Nibrella viscosa]|uniref:Caspase family protein n=1 Tax=Nibrella viscosa TaxID=1084524 RepID=A0ABP8KY21_9BACT